MSEILKKCNPPIRKPRFWRSQAFKIRPKIDAKTPSKSGLSWIPSWNPKKHVFMLKGHQDGTPKFPIFFNNRLKILAMTVFGLRCLLEASKSLPRASQEPPQSPQEALHSLQEPPFRPPRGLQEPALQTCLQSWTDNNDRWPVTVQSIVGIIDRWSKESLIVGRWQDINDKGSMQARWRTNAPAVMDIYIYIYIICA